MHLDASQEKRTDCQFLLNFFDYFLQNAKFAYIKETDFVLRPSCASCQSTKMKIYEFEEFEILNNFVDHKVVKDRRVKDGKIKDRKVEDRKSRIEESRMKPLKMTMGQTNMTWMKEKIKTLILSPGMHKV